VTGEVVHPVLLERWFARYAGKRVVNAYGPPEACDDICHYHMKEVPSTETVAIGRPVQNMRIYIVNGQGKLCPAGIYGEIVVAGIGVGRGYWHDEERTARSFGEDSFGEGGRLYRTGDRGRWLADGNIEYQGRLDEQVKIRGYRIELGEIESVLNGAAGVKAAAVVVQEDRGGNKRLVGYVVMEGGRDGEEGVERTIDREGLMRYLQERLPEYMVPAQLVAMDALPLTISGKVDRKALPEPEYIDGVDYEGPRDATEVALVELWQGLLGVQQVGIHDNFFALGGHSLLAIKASTAISRTMGVLLPLRTFFELATVESLAKYIRITQYQPSEESNFQKVIKL